MTDRPIHPATAEILRYFEYDHLPLHLAAISRPVHDLAHGMAQVLEGPELTAGLRKLLEAKDCFVRATLPKPDPQTVDRPNPERDFKAASDRFQAAITAATMLPTEAEHLAALDAAIEDYNRAVDAYNAYAEEYNRAHGLTEDDDDAETLRHLVRNGDTATLEPPPAEMETAVHGLLADLGQRARDEKAGGR